MQEVPLRRTAAIKVLRAGIISKHIRQRFDAERQVLAEMHHPNVEGIFDAGTTDDGRPWFAMPLIDGSPITVHCDEERLSLRERLMLFLEVCAGVSHAHSKGIIHRDLKPSNILVARSEVAATAKVIDFGIAKFRELDLFSAVDRTAHGAFLGTLAYASPEQASIGSAYADARSDVFSLGALLHELLCGLSHHVADPSTLGMSDLARFEPTRMSQRLVTLARTDLARLETLATRRSTSAPSLDRALRSDLDAIVMTALDPQPTRRYGTVDAFADDVRAMLEGRPVQATPPTRRYLLSRFIGRHRVESAAVAAAIVIVLGALSTVSWMLMHQRTLTHTLERALCISSLAAADGALARGEFAGAKEALALAPLSHRAFEWNYRMRLADASVATSENLGGQSYGIDHSPDGESIAAIGDGGFVILDATTLKTIRTISIPLTVTAKPQAGTESWWVAWSPDGTRIAAGALTGVVGVWNAATGEELVVRNADEKSIVGEWIDDSTIAIGTYDGELSLVDAATLTPRVTATLSMGSRIVAILHNAGGPIYAASTHTLAAFDPATLAQLWRVQTPASTVGAALDVSGTRIALTFRMTRPMTIQSTVDGALITTIEAAHGAWHAQWSPAGSILWTAGFDQRVLALDGETYAVKAVLGGSPSQIWTISSANEHTAVSGDTSGQLRAWDLEVDAGQRTLALSKEPLMQCAFTGDGQLALVSDTRGELYCVDLATMRLRWSVALKQTVVAVRLLDKFGVLVVCGDGSLRRLNVDDGATLEESSGGAYCSRGVIAHDGSFIATLRGGEVVCLELPSGRERWKAAIKDRDVETMAIAPDDSLVALSSFGQPVEILATRSGRALTSRSLGSGTSYVQFSPDSQSIWMCSQESEMEAACLDVHTGEKLAKYGGLSNAGRELTLAADAPRAAVRCASGLIKVFEPGHPHDLMTIHSGVVKAVPVFAPQADRLLLLRADGVLECFDGSPIVER